MEPISKSQGKRSFMYNKTVEEETEDDDDEEDEDDEEEEDDDLVPGAQGFQSPVDDRIVSNKRPTISTNSNAPSGGARAVPVLVRSGAGGSTARHGCQADTCNADLAEAKHYHRRHKICQVHAKAPVVLVAGVQQRFCQQCSRFHGLSEFDDAKRSCRRRLAGHNERRRKSSSDIQRDGSS